MFFYLYLESFRYVYRKLVLKIVDDESDLHRGYVVVDINTLILYWGDNNPVFFFEKFALNIIGYHGVWLKTNS